MSNSAARVLLRLDATGQRWQGDRGAVAIGEVVAIMAVPIIVVMATVAALEVAGIDAAGWIREQLGMAP